MSDSIVKILVLKPFCDGSSLDITEECGSTAFVSQNISIINDAHARARSKICAQRSR